MSIFARRHEIKMFMLSNALVVYCNKKKIIMLFEILKSPSFQTVPIIALLISPYISHTLIYLSIPKKNSINLSSIRWVPSNSLCTSEAAMVASKEFITTVVVGKDVVPRLGLHQELFVFNCPLTFHNSTYITGVIYSQIIQKKKFKKI